MQSLRDRDWIALDGRLEPIDFDGFSDDRSPPELADLVLEAYSRPGDWVLDPFAGLGTTLLSAKRLGRASVGFEPDLARHAWVDARLSPPNRIINAPAQGLAGHGLPRFQLAFTSPPYPTVRLEDDPWGPTYFRDMTTIFSLVADAVAPNGHIVVEVSNILTEDGYRPLVGQMADALSTVMTLEREIARVNTSDWPAGPGVGHGALLVFRPMARPSPSR